MSNEAYKWRKKWRLEPAGEVDQEPEKTVLGWDIKIDPEGEPRIIEYHAGSFGIRGFREAFRHGSIGEAYRSYKEEGELAEYMDKYASKDESHKVLDDLMPDIISEEDLENFESEIIVGKPRKGYGGDGVQIFCASEDDGYDARDHEVLERFTDSKDIEVSETPYDAVKGYYMPVLLMSASVTAGSVPTFFLLSFTEMSGEIREYFALGGLFAASVWTACGVNDASEGFLGFSPADLIGGALDSAYSAITGEDYVYSGKHDGCMRYASGVELDEDGLVVEDLGGYWRTTEKPKDSDVDDLNRKYLANYGAGSPVEATDEDLIKAQDISLEAVEALYKSWLEEEKGHEDVELDIEEL